MKTKFLIRIRFLLGGFLVVALLLIVRLYFVQVIHGDAYRERAEGQYTATPSVLSADRGKIIFRDKDGREVAAAVMQAGYRIAIKPDTLADAQRTYEQLSEYAVIPEERFFKSAAKKDDPYEEVAFRIPEEAGQAIRELKIPGVVVVRERWRLYPAENQAAHLLGFVGFKGDQRVGRYGLERYWEDTLRRDTGNLYGNFFAELFSSAHDITTNEYAGVEGDVITSIEPMVMQRLEETLAHIHADTPAAALGGIVMDPQTGAIIALSALPDFNPNTFNEVKDQAVFVNPLVESVYELGSIMKPLTMAVGLDTGVVGRRTTYEDTGCIMRSGARVCNYDLRARGVVDMQEVLNQSLNTGATYVAEQVGAARFAEYVRAFGLGEETGIDLPNEVPGILSGLDSKSAVDLASASFGQGIAVTPIAMTRALAALANKGVLPEPHVVDAVRYPSGITKEVWHQGETRVISEAAAEEVTRMLVEVVDGSLVGGTLKQEHYSIAAKTGTAQISGGRGGYAEGKFLHSFFGYFPAHDPQFIIFLFAVEPQGVQYASQSLAKPFMDMTSFLINYYNIPPDR